MCSASTTAGMTSRRATSSWRRRTAASTSCATTSRPTCGGSCKSGGSTHDDGLFDAHLERHARVILAVARVFAGCGESERKILTRVEVAAVEALSGVAVGGRRVSFVVVVGERHCRTALDDDAGRREGQVVD